MVVEKERLAKDVAGAAHVRLAGDLPPCYSHPAPPPPRHLVRSAFMSAVCPNFSSQTSMFCSSF